MRTDKPAYWALKYRTLDGHGLWRITYEGRDLWQYSPALHPPSAHGGYSSKAAVMRMHRLDESKLIEATP